MDTTLENNYDQAQISKKTGKPLLWIGLVSIIMLFAGLTSAVVVRMSDANWMNFEMPEAFRYSSIIIILSSLSIHLALILAKKDKVKQVQIPVFATLILGAAFIVAQFMGYSELIERGIYFTGANHTASGSYLYIITAVHLLHLVGGIIALLVVVFNSIKYRYDSKNLLGLQLCSTYWHFLGILWIYLYVFFSFVI